MPTSAENLRDLHALHQRSRALRDRLTSGPKTLTARRAALAKRQADLAAAREAIKKSKADIKNKEVQVQATRDRTADLRTKLNTIKKQVEYDAIRNEIAHANATATRVEDEILELMQRLEAQEAELKTLDAEVAAQEKEVAAFAQEIEARATTGAAQLIEIDAAVVAAEQIIPEDQRDQYRRVLKQRADDAMAPVEDNACHGCFVSVTAQTVNELINAEHLVFCKTCGRILYLAEAAVQNLRRKAQ